MFRTKQFKILAVFLILIVIALITLLFNLKSISHNQNYYVSPILSLSPFDVIYGELNNTQLPIIIYENYLDHFSKDLQTSLSQAQDDFKNLVFIYRPYINAHDTKAQEMALVLACANEQKKGKEVREALFTLEQTFVLSDEFIINNNLNAKQLKTCLSDVYLRESLAQISNDAKVNNIYGSPTLMVGSELVLGARPYEDYIDSGGDRVEGLHSVIARQLNIN